MDVFELLKTANSMNASDLHLVVGSPPVVRIDGSLRTLSEMPVIISEDMELVLNELASDKNKAIFYSNLELDFGFVVPSVGRLRCNVAMQRGTVSLAIRILPIEPPTIDNLNLPAIFKELALNHRGFIVVSGPTGSGKTSTLAAMINHINIMESRRVVTIEDPIEYTYTDIRSTITQRELRSDTHSFYDGLKHSLRQDPDVIMVGEMRDLETASAVLTIAETGHLVLTSGHAPTAPRAIERIIDLFPPEERELAQARLASMLIGVLCQQLIPTIDGRGRIPVVEIMLASQAVRNLIREGKIYLLRNTMRTSAQTGMQLFDSSLVNLYMKGTISRDSLFAYCTNRDEVIKDITRQR